MTTITIEQSLLEQALNALLLPCDRWNKQQFLIVKGAIEALKAALAAPASAPATALNDRLRNESKRKPMTDQDTLDLFNRIQLRMRFTDADARPFASGVASAEFFHGIKGTP